MTSPLHTYGPTCLLSDDDPDSSTWYFLSDPPKVRAQFFYTSSLPIIDDPLSSLPPAGGQDQVNKRAPPQPFSVRDNIALEEAWKTLEHTRSQQAKSQITARTSGISVPGQTPPLQTRQTKQSRSREDVGLNGNQDSLASKPASFLDDRSFQSFESQPSGEPGGAEAHIGVSWEGSYIRSEQNGDMGDVDRGPIPDQGKRELSLTNALNTTKRTSCSSLFSDDAALEGLESRGLRRKQSRDVSISGSPFIRAPVTQTQSPLGLSVEYNTSKDDNPELHTEPRSIDSHQTAPKPSGLRKSIHRERSSESSTSETEEVAEADQAQVKIPVGVSRLHLVELPNLKMKPIYWNLVQDVSNVLRATWFYKNTMLPVETELANKLEDGYAYLKPWTNTWQDELNSCVENGADAEMKIVYKLWPKDELKSHVTPITSRPGSSTSEGTAGTKSEPLSFGENRAAGKTPLHSESVKPFMNYGVIYADGRDAQILRPSLLPSASRGRRPLSAIRKGRQIGIPVVRGFSRRLWDQLHPSKPSPADVRNFLRITQSRAMSQTDGEQICYACAIEELRPAPTDLLLVIHGIGQKLSERMESFHFTYNINTFRRNINMELNNEAVWPHISQDHGGIMILPVNWRSTLSLEDINLEAGNSEDPAANHYSLKDITPETIPAVRALISDVILDIPYYLSHHKAKMIQAVAKEANRVYRLWCKNNPGFQQHGRVHILGHSLGSAMALDVLSHQPTKIPHFDFSTTSVHGNFFEFDTKNLFICGSPVGLLLYLNKANLLPRRGRDKPGHEGEDQLYGVAGEATYGCLAVDNIYNIVHDTDPIAYRVNGAVDAELANSLKIASIPSSSASFWQSFGSVFRWNSAATSVPTRPAAVVKLPSNVELETHDFTREEIAEKRMLLLNDNGQIDYFISGGGGPINIQYLNMLSAHSSYWSLPEFLRFLIIEIGRKQGKESTLPAFRAAKKKGWKAHKG